VRCPRCTETRKLTKASYGDVEIDQCTECHGIWLDAGELTDLQAWFTSNDQFLEDTRNAGSLPRHDDLLESVCPVDDTQLKGCRLPATEDLDRPVLDICPTCLGIWVDGGEREDLHAILMSRHANGLETQVELYVPAPRWHYYMRYMVPDFIYRRIIPGVKS